METFRSSTLLNSISNLYLMVFHVLCLTSLICTILPRFQNSCTNSLGCCVDIPFSQLKNRFRRFISFIIRRAKFHFLLNPKYFLIDEIFRSERTYNKNKTKTTVKRVFLRHFQRTEQEMERMGRFWSYVLQ